MKNYFLSVDQFTDTMLHYQIERVIDFTRTKINEYRTSESNIKDIDLAIETGEFINQQVVLSASQSVLAQSNGIVQSALQFLA